MTWLPITTKPATYFVWVTGQSMKGVWIRNGDNAEVDCRIEPQADCVVVAGLDGEMLINQLDFGPAGEVQLKPANPRYPTVTISPEQAFYIWGVVTWPPTTEAASEAGAPVAGSSTEPSSPLDQSGASNHIQGRARSDSITCKEVTALLDSRLLISIKASMPWHSAKIKARH